MNTGGEEGGWCGRFKKMMGSRRDMWMIWRMVGKKEGKWGQQCPTLHCFPLGANATIGKSLSKLLWQLNNAWILSLSLDVRVICGSFNLNTYGTLD